MEIRTLRPRWLKWRCNETRQGVETVSFWVELKVWICLVVCCTVISSCCSLFLVPSLFHSLQHQKLKFYRISGLFFSEPVFWKKSTLRLASPIIMGLLPFGKHGWLEYPLFLHVDKTVELNISAWSWEFQWLGTHQLPYLVGNKTQVLVPKRSMFCAPKPKSTPANYHSCLERLDHFPRCISELRKKCIVFYSRHEIAIPIHSPFCHQVSTMKHWRAGNYLWWIRSI